MIVIGTLLVILLLVALLIKMIINKVLKKGGKIGSLNSAIDLKTIPLLGGGKSKNNDVIAFVSFFKI